MDPSIDNFSEFKDFFIRYPHIAQKVVSTFGSKECRAFLTSLLTDSRDGKRQGFPPEDAKLIFSLLQKHDQLHPEFSNDIRSPGFVLMPRKTHVQLQPSTTVINIIAKIIVAILVAAILFKYVF